MSEESIEKIQKKLKVSETEEKNIEQQQQSDEENDKKHGKMTQEQRMELLEKLTPRRIFFQQFNQYDTEKDVYNFINRFHPDNQKFGVEKILKKKGKNFSMVEFKSQEDKEAFEKAFNDPSNKQKQKKVKLRPKDKFELDKVRFGKHMDKIGEHIQKISTRKIPTQKQWDEIRSQKVVEKVCPLLETPYQEQIQMKRESFNKVLDSWGEQAKKQLGTAVQFGPEWMQNDKPSELTDIVECEEQYRLRYRNKMELTIGKDIDGNITVGMNKGSQSEGTVVVESAQDCAVLTEEGLLIGRMIENYVKNHQSLKPFDRYDGGFFKCVTIRQSPKTKQIMIIISMFTLGVEQQVLEQEKQAFIQMFIENQSQELQEQLQKDGYKIVSLNIQYSEYRGEGQQSEEKVDCIYGTPYYQEEILGKLFNVGPLSFVQNHTQQCDRLYSLVQDLIKEDINNDTIFLDVCSGIGTIGMCMAEKCKEVIGIEMIKDACVAAEENAKLNNISNYKVICSKVEDVMSDIIQNLKRDNPNTKIVAVVDPPRPGLHKNVLKHLRSCDLIDNLVYVACSPSSILENLNFLCLPSGDRGRKGTPFNPCKSFVVDLFPMTTHYEGVFFLTRSKQE